MSNHERAGEPEGWAAGGIAFAACLLTIVGVFQALAGLTAILDDEFFVVAGNYAFDLDTTAWGWAHLILGVILVATGMGLFAGRAWAVGTAVVLASVSAIANFLFIPYYPFWAIVMIAFDVWVIWSLTRPGAVAPR